MGRGHSREIDSVSWAAVQGGGAQSVIGCKLTVGLLQEPNTDQELPLGPP